MLDYIKNLFMQYVEIDPSEITEESRLRTDIGLTSFDIVNIAEEIGAEYGIMIPDEDIPSLKTVGDYVKYIEERI